MNRLTIVEMHYDNCQDAFPQLSNKYFP